MHARISLVQRKAASAEARFLFRNVSKSCSASMQHAEKDTRHHTKHWGLLASIPNFVPLEGYGSDNFVVFQSFRECLTNHMDGQQ